MIRRTPLRPSRKPLQARRATAPSDVVKLKAERARVTGAEYRTVYLAGVFKAQGCDICGRFRPPAQQHHVRSGGKGRKADATETVILCADCHRKGHDRGFGSLLAAHGLPPDHLDLRAAEHTAAATAAGFLPVELCEECKTWHSQKFMLWEVQAQDFEIAPGFAFRNQTIECQRRICTACAPEGPP